MARARVNGFSAWVNLRLQPYDHHVTNVLLDLLTGTNMKVLLSSVTGREFRKIQSFNGCVYLYRPKIIANLFYLSTPSIIKVM